MTCGLKWFIGVFMQFYLVEPSFIQGYHMAIKINPYVCMITRVKEFYRITFLLCVDGARLVSLFDDSW